MASEKRVRSPSSVQEPDSAEEKAINSGWSQSTQGAASQTDASSGLSLQAAADLGSTQHRRSHSPTVDVDLVISALKVPECGAEVASVHANEHTADRQVQAYAKLAGRNWTYYVQQLEIVIGRSAADSSERVDIDLAPSKIVSRRHAVIRYNLASRVWEVVTFGRNGLRLDGALIRPGNTASLHSGHVIDVGNVQMMFVLPDADPVVAPVYIHKMQEQQRQQQLSSQTQGAGSYQKGLNSNAASADPGHSATALGPGVPAPPAASADGSETSAAYPRGVTIVSRPQVPSTQYLVQDLGSDGCKDIKPPFSYATMISQAILSTPEHMMTLADIYAWIASHYAFYRHSKPGWQNSIRHNLSLNKAFAKVARKENEPGKGSKWHIVEAYKEELVKKATTGRNLRGGYLPRWPYEGSPPAVAASLPPAAGRKRSHTQANEPKPEPDQQYAQQVKEVSQSHKSQPGYAPQPASQTAPAQTQAPAQQLAPSQFASIQSSQDQVHVVAPGPHQHPHQPPPPHQQQPQQYQVPMAYQNMGDNLSFQMQGFPYMAPFGMPYYPQHPGQPMVPMMPMPSQQVSGQQQQKPELNDHSSHHASENKPQMENSDKDGSTASSSGTEQQQPKLEYRNGNASAAAHEPSQSDMNGVRNQKHGADGGRPEGHAEGLGQPDGEKQPSKQDDHNDKEADAKLNESELQTPARPFHPDVTRTLGETPFSTNIKLAPQQGSGVPESSPALWKYMNLESTPNNATPNAATRAGAGSNTDDFGPTSSPPAPATNVAKIARQQINNSDVKRTTEAIPLFE